MNNQRYSNSDISTPQRRRVGWWDNAKDIESAKAQVKTLMRKSAHASSFDVDDAAIDSVAREIRSRENNQKGGSGMLPNMQVESIDISTPTARKMKVGGDPENSGDDASLENHSLSLKHQKEPHNSPIPPRQPNPSVHPDPLRAATTAKSRSATLSKPHRPNSSRNVRNLLMDATWDDRDHLPLTNADAPQTHHSPQTQVLMNENQSTSIAEKVAESNAPYGDGRPAQLEEINNVHRQFSQRIAHSDGATQRKTPTAHVALDAPLQNRQSAASKGDDSILSEPHMAAEVEAGENGVPLQSSEETFVGSVALAAEAGSTENITKIRSTEKGGQMKVADENGQPEKPTHHEEKNPADEVWTVHSRDRTPTAMEASTSHEVGEVDKHEQNDDEECFVVQKTPKLNRLRRDDEVVEDAANKDFHGPYTTESRAEKSFEVEGGRSREKHHRRENSEKHKSRKNSRKRSAGSTLTKEVVDFDQTDVPEQPSGTTAAAIPIIASKSEKRDSPPSAQPATSHIQIQPHPTQNRRTTPETALNVPAETRFRLAVFAMMKFCHEHEQMRTICDKISAYTEDIGQGSPGEGFGDDGDFCGWAKRCKNYFELRRAMERREFERALDVVSRQQEDIQKRYTNIHSTGKESGAANTSSKTAIGALLLAFDDLKYVLSKYLFIHSIQMNQADRARKVIERRLRPFLRAESRKKRATSGEVDESGKTGEKEQKECGSSRDRWFAYDIQMLTSLLDIFDTDSNIPKPESHPPQWYIAWDWDRETSVFWASADRLALQRRKAKLSNDGGAAKGDSTVLKDNDTGAIPFYAHALVDCFYPELSATGGQAGAEQFQSDIIKNATSSLMLTLPVLDAMTMEDAVLHWFLMKKDPIEQEEASKTPLAPAHVSQSDFNTSVPVGGISNRSAAASGGGNRFMDGTVTFGGMGGLLGSDVSADQDLSTRKGGKPPSPKPLGRVEKSKPGTVVSTSIKGKDRARSKTRPERQRRHAENSETSSVSKPQLQPHPPPAKRSAAHSSNPSAGGTSVSGGGGGGSTVGTSSTASSSGAYAGAYGMAELDKHMPPSSHEVESADFALSSVCGPVLGYVRTLDVTDVPETGQIIAATAGGEDRASSHISIWDVRLGTLLSQLDNGTHKPVVTLTFHPIQKSTRGWLLSSDMEFDVKLWDWRKRECLRVWRKHHSRILYRVAFVPGLSGRAASCSADQTLKFWDIDTDPPANTSTSLPSNTFNSRPPIITQQQSYVLGSVHANEPFTSFVFCHGGGSDVDDDGGLAPQKRGASSSLAGVGYGVGGESGAQILIAALAYSIRIYKMRTLTLLHTIPLKDLKLNDNQLRLIDLSSQMVLRVYSARQISPGTRIEGHFSPCGTFVYAGTWDIRAFASSAGGIISGTSSISRRLSSRRESIIHSLTKDDTVTTSIPTNPNLTTSAATTTLRGGRGSGVEAT
ncbi:hypothetical protein HK102_011026, partial [Quaeritorhiza haematococci]